MFNFVILFAIKTIRFVEAWFICATFLILVKTVKYLTFFYKFIWKEFALFGFVNCLTEWAQGNKVGPKQDALKASCPIFNSLFHYKFTYSLNFRPNSHEKDLPNQQDELTARHPALPDPGCHSRAIVVSCLNWLDTECFFLVFFFCSTVLSTIDKVGSKHRTFKAMHPMLTLSLLKRNVNESRTSPGPCLPLSSFCSVMS